MIGQRPELKPVDTQPVVAVVAPSAPPFGTGGVASAHFNIHRCLQRIGCNTTLLTFNEFGTSPRDSEIVRFGASRRLRSLLDLGVYCYLKTRRSRSPAYQLVDIVNSIPGVLKMNRHLRDLHADVTIIPDHGAPGLFLRKQETPVILVAHHNPLRFVDNPLLGEFCRLDAAKAVALEQRALQRVDAVICPSAYMKQVFQETYQFAGEITVIPNPVDEIFIDAIPTRDVRHELQLPPEVPAVYIPSAGSSLKGAQFVFEIVRRLAKAYNGPMAFFLSGQIGPGLKAELARVPANARLYMPGQVSHPVNIALMKSCSFGVSPTLVENFSMALLEAGFCEVPMVTFEVGGNPELISEGENGFMVPYLDVESLVEKAEMLLEAKYCNKLRATTGRSVRARFDSCGIARQYLALCERHLPTPAGR